MSDQESIDALNSIIPPLKKIDLGKVSEGVDGVKEEEKKVECPIETQAEGVSGGGCPFFNGKKSVSKQNSAPTKKFHEWQTSISIASEPVGYHDYLFLDKILTSQFPVSKKYGNLVHDEHLFIVIHQGLFLLEI